MVASYVLLVDAIVRAGVRCALSGDDFRWVAGKELRSQEGEHVQSHK